MKRLFLGATVFAAIGMNVPASATDMPVKAAYSASQAFSWTGCYVGANAGGHIGRDKLSTTTAAPNFGPGVPAQIDATTPVTLKPSGLEGGGQLGCNYQTGVYVLGLEGDLEGLSGSAGRTINAYPPGRIPLANSFKSTWLSTVRARAGVAFDHTLLYVTGGVAFGHLNATDTLVTFGGAAVSTVNTSTTRTGGTIGAGIERAFGSNWTAKFEYLYVDLGSFDAGIPCPGGCGAADDMIVHHRYTDNIMRVGLNYKFGSAAYAK